MMFLPLAPGRLPPCGKCCLPNLKERHRMGAALLRATL